MSLLLLPRSHVLTQNRAVDHQVTLRPEPDYEMLQQEKQSQILERYNKGNRARYWNFTSREIGPATRILQQGNRVGYCNVTTRETQPDT